ncbi:MAG: hypothetical protein Q9178_002712 [Gyalolechia marmorata]
MKESMAKLLSRIEATGESSKTLRIHYILKACTSDIITKYAFGESFHFLDEEDYAAPYMESTDVYHLFNHAFCHFPWIGTLIASAPLWAIKNISPRFDGDVEQARVKDIRNSPNPDRVKSTIFEGVLNSKLPEIEKSDARMAHEAQLVVFAGQGTTGSAYTLSAALYELLANPQELQKTKAELSKAIPDPSLIPSFAQLEALPYFSAVMQEILRIHPGIVSRMPRVSPESAIIYTNKRNGKSYHLPPGTPTNMTVQIAHSNPEVFDSPYDFRPQRWLDNPRLDRAFIGFARGTRNCIGMNFARQEMFIILATIIRKYELYVGQEGPTLELYETTRERDIDVNRDMIIPFPAPGSHGLRVKVRS